MAKAIVEVRSLLILTSVQYESKLDIQFRLSANLVVAKHHGWFGPHLGYPYRSHLAFGCLRRYQQFLNHT
jgi:hypothetical protein